MSADDQDNVARVLAGDTTAFAAIVRRWQGPLIQLAYRFVRDRSRAEDMAQEAFLRAFRNLGSWRQESAFSTWLFALATNVYRTELRRHPQATLPLDELLHTPVDQAPGAEALLQVRGREATVQAAVQSLPARYRDVLVLYYFHEMDVALTAVSLGIPEGTVKAHLFRARALLRGKLQALAGSQTFHPGATSKEPV